jgi:hypothetical protein
VSSTARMSTTQLSTANIRFIIDLYCVESLSIVAFGAVGADSIVAAFITDLFLTAIELWAARHTKDDQHPAAAAASVPG